VSGGLYRCACFLRLLGVVAMGGVRFGMSFQPIRAEPD
jgi:hypothetical protein